MKRLTNRLKHTLINFLLRLDIKLAFQDILFRFLIYISRLILLDVHIAFILIF